MRKKVKQVTQNKQVRQFVKVSIVSSTGQLIDLLVFYILTSILADTYFNTFLSNALSVIFSTIYCYIFNRIWCFRSNGKKRKEAPAFFALVIFKLLTSSFLVAHIHVWLPSINLLIVKILVDFILFFLGYYIQSKYIFKKL